MAALGEIAHIQARAVGRSICPPFLPQHAVIGMVVQASFGIDILKLAETDPRRPAPRPRLP